MLSRASILARQQPKILATFNTRTTHTTSVCNADDKSAESGNVPRPVRLAEPGKVRHGFIPEEWFQIFYKKTGVTGPYTFGVGLTTYMFSKEIYVMEHEYYTGLSIAIMAIFAIKKFGPNIAAYLDKEIETYEGGWREGRETEQAALEKTIKDEKHSQWQADGEIQLMEAKRENVQLQLEANYRERMMTAYREVKRRLDYQLEKENVERRLAQKHMISWVLAKVLASITPEQEKETLNNCITELNRLAKA